MLVHGPGNLHRVHTDRLGGGAYRWGSDHIEAVENPFVQNRVGEYIQQLELEKLADTVVY